ncbi:MAG: response regulator [bacterium]
MAVMEMDSGIALLESPCGMAGKMSGKSGKLILVVEDDEDMNELVCTILQQAGYQTESAFSGGQGIEKAAAILPDLVLLDIVLPDGSGVDVCRTLMRSEDTKGIPIIMLTVRKELSAKLSSYVAGAKRFITKPFQVDELVHEVRLALRQHLASPAEDTLLDPRD